MASTGNAMDAESRDYTKIPVGKANAYDSVGHGIVFLTARDCNQKPLAGIAFSTSATDPLQRLFVTSNGQLTTNTTTGEVGSGAFVNVPPGIHTFTAEFAATKKRLGSTRILVRAGAVTSVDILPSP